MKKSLLGVVLSLCCTAVIADNSASDPLSSLQAKPVNQLEWGVFKANFYLSKALDKHRGDRIEGTKLKLNDFSVDYVPKDNVIVVGAIFSGRDNEFSSGSCADSLLSYRKHVLASMGQAPTAEEYLSRVFASGKASPELTANLMKSVHLMVLLQGREGGSVLACSADLHGENIKFKTL